ELDADRPAPEPLHELDHVPAVPASRVQHEVAVGHADLGNDVEEHVRPPRMQGLVEQRLDPLAGQLVSPLAVELLEGPLVRRLVPHNGESSTNRRGHAVSTVRQNARVVETFRRDGLVFDVGDRGLQDGEAIVLLHGFPENRTCWDAMVPTLTDAGYRTLAPD